MLENPPPAGRHVPELSFPLARTGSEWDQVARVAAGGVGGVHAHFARRQSIMARTRSSLFLMAKLMKFVSTNTW